MRGLTLSWEAQRLRADWLHVRLAPPLPPAPAPPAPTREPVSEAGTPLAHLLPVPKELAPAPAVAHEEIANDVLSKDMPSEPKEFRNAEELVKKPVEQPGPSAKVAEQAPASVERARQAEILAQTQGEVRRQEQLRRDAALAEQAAQQEATRAELAKQELAKLEAKQEAARQDSARQEAVRQEGAQHDDARIAAARQVAAEQELAGREAAKREQAQQNAARQDAIRQEAARQEAARQEAARQELAKKELAVAERAAQEAARDDRLRQIGKQLDLERAQRENAVNRPANSPLPTASSLRRGWLFGRADPSGDLVLYADAMSRKIEMNMTIDMVRELVKQPYTQPTVTVAVRADGSVEKVTFEVSSGVAALDDAIRKVIASQASYGPFSPSLARQYDVIEIRRTWLFDHAIRLQ